MAITASGLYFLSFEKMTIDTLGQSLEAEDGTAGLVRDGYTPAFDTHDFHADITNEVDDANYAADTVTGTEIAVSPAGTLQFDHIDTLYDNGGGDDVTVVDAMAQYYVTNVGASATDQLIYLLDFQTAASSTASTFTTQINALGAFTIDLTP
jgi:hypothetical protein